MSQVIKAEEVKRHNTRNNLWIVYKNDVYDVTKYVDEHPGGVDPLLEAAGKDATAAFEDVGHSSTARSTLKKFKIGTLAPGDTVTRMKPRLWVPSSKYHRKCTETEAQRRRRERIERSGGKSSALKWAMLALAVAIIAGVAYKKYAT